MRQVILMPSRRKPPGDLGDPIDRLWRNKVMPGSAVRKFRKAQGLTQPEMAMLLGISAQTISDWERDHASPPPYLHLALAELGRQLDVRRAEMAKLHDGQTE